MSEPTAPVRRVLLSKPGEEHALAIDPALFTTAPIGPNGETYSDLGFSLSAYEDTREPYVAPPPPPAPPPPAPPP